MSRPEPPTPTAAKRTWVDKSIASQDNPVFRSLLECLTTKGVKKHGLFIVSGDKVVGDIVGRHSPRIRNIIVCTELHLDVTGREPFPKTAALEDLISASREKLGSSPRPMVIALSKALFEQLDQFGTHEPVLSVSAWDFDQVDLNQEPKGLEILCALSDPSNLGALIRSAAAFKANKIILLQESASPFHAKAVRAASAATFEIKFERGPSISQLSASAEANERFAFALDMNGIPLTTFKWPENARLLLGEEGRGVPDSARIMQKVAIPIAAGVESLNATVAASIALYSYRSQYP